MPPIFTSLFEKVQQEFDPKRFLVGFLILVIGYSIARIISTFVQRTALHRTTAHQAMLISRIVYYLVLVPFLISAIQHVLGVDLNTLIAAFLILIFGVGFASQSAISNVISGMFLIAEKPFLVGDYIILDEIEGEVISIDLVSVKIRTRDNLLSRVPNETLLKNKFINITKFPIRRMDIVIQLCLDADVSKVESIMLDVARDNPQVLQDPPPGFFLTGFKESSMQVKFIAWTKNEFFFTVRTQVYREILKKFNEEKVEMHIPQQKILINRD